MKNVLEAIKQDAENRESFRVAQLRLSEARFKGRSTQRLEASVKRREQEEYAFLNKLRKSNLRKELEAADGYYGDMFYELDDEEDPGNEAHELVRRIIKKAKGQ